MQITPSPAIIGRHTLTAFDFTMAPKPDNTPRKAHDLHTQLEEENLWDLDDDWDDDSHEDTGEGSGDEPLPETTETPEPKPEDNYQEEETGEIPNSSPIADQPEPERYDLETDELNLEYDTEPSGDDDRAESPHEEPAAELDTPVEATGEENAPEPVPEPPAPSDDVDGTEENAPLAEPLKKLGLKPVEKIALSLIALLFVGMTVWGIVWLKRKNNIAKTDNELTFPIAGSYATVDAFSTYWKAPGDTPGTKLGAVIVPAASLTLGDGSSSGVLRIFFRNTSKESVGDPITITFSGGVFTNGGKNIEVSATDGFHFKGNFHAYQMDDSQAWEVEVLEAENASVPRSGFKTIINTTMSPTLR